MTTASPFIADALEANQRGQLTDRQQHNLGALSAYRRRNALSIAAFLVGGALIVVFFARPDAPVLTRALTTGAAVAIAAFLVVRSITGFDALTRDLRDGHVQTVQGAIGKRRASAGRTQGSYFLDIGDQSFKVGSSTYSWVPPAGWARVYFLPRSRMVVNIEILPNPSAPPALTPENAAQLLQTSAFAGRREANEARAGLASMGEALEAGFDRTPHPPPATARDPRQLERAIVGTWKNPVMRVTFSGDGRVVVRMFIGERNGRWSVDTAGRLRSDITGSEQTADAWIEGNRLTIAADGEGLVFTRESE